MLAKSKARDRASDGCFLTGVLTTGIYCLPSCPAKQPLDRNIRFFATEEAARQAGLRPCKRCKPNHFYRNYDPGEALIAGLAARLPSTLEDCHTLADMTVIAGVSQTKLHQLFRQYFHQSPVGFLNRLRAKTAARILAATDLDLLEVQAAAGYRQASTFHSAVLLNQGLSPGRYRNLPETSDYLIQLPENYRPDLIMPYWFRDPGNLIFQNRGHWYWRSFQVDGNPCLIQCRFERNGFRVIRAHVPPGVDTFGLHEQILRILGLPCDPKPYEARLEKLGMSDLIEDGIGLRVPGTPTVFEALVWSIIGQQINLAFAYKLRNRLIQLAGTPLTEGMFAHPPAEAVADLDEAALLEHQFSKRKAEYLIGISKRVVSGALVLEALRDKPMSQVERWLLAERGIGRWTARYVAMRGLGFADCVPVGDAGLRRALRNYHGLPDAPDEVETERLMAMHQPFRSLATCHFWRHLSSSEASSGQVPALKSQKRN